MEENEKLHKIRVEIEKAKQENADFVECDFLWEYSDKIKKDKRYELHNEPRTLNQLHICRNDGRLVYGARRRTSVQQRP